MRFVVSLNLHRRHIDKSQRALATTAVYAWVANGTNRFEKKVDIQCQPRIEIKTTAQLADIAGVHTNTIRQAKAVYAWVAHGTNRHEKKSDIQYHSRTDFATTAQLAAAALLNVCARTVIDKGTPELAAPRSRYSWRGGK